MVDIPRYVESRRSRYNKLPVFFRIVLVIVAFLLGMAGLILAIAPPPLFDAGVILLLLSLSVLSFQFTWAHNTVIYIIKKLADKAFRKKLFIVTGLIFIATIYTIISRFALTH